MDNFIRAFRRMPGLYVPYLQPFWHEQDVYAANAFLNSQAIEDVRGSLQSRLKSQFPSSKEIVLTDSGKSALYVALKMLGVKPQDEVIMPSYCCASVIASVVRAGCTPVLADSDQHFNISKESVAEALTPRSRAILVPHLFGLKADSIEAIVALARRQNIAVIEDVAQAFGLQLRDGMPAGSLGDAAIFSAGLGKPIMGPGGGWVILNRSIAVRPELGAEPIEASRHRLKLFLRRFWGTRAKRGFAEISYALHARFAARLLRNGFDIHRWAHKECLIREISVVDAWFAASQIETIKSNLELRRQNAQRWRTLLDAAKVQYVTLPDMHNVYAAFLVLFQGTTSVRQAMRFRKELEHSGIATEPCYMPLHMRGYGSPFPRTRMPVTESMWQSVFALPVRPNLQPADWQRIEKAVRRAGSALAS
jgi:dTDP-4-amino-4,6-dideoxygalactose transaminase